jgi:hypothetical protein
MPLALRALMPVSLLVVVSAAFSQTSDPAHEYAIDGVALGSRAQLIGAAYREYRCGSSQQSDGFIYCQKIRFERSSGGSYNVMYSFLHSRDGTVVYVDRYQQPAFLNAREAEQRIEEFSAQFGEAPRTRKQPDQPGRLDGVLVVWGKTVLEPIGNARIQGLAEGRSETTEYLVDFLGDYVRSAREHLPIYRFRGGAGFVWIASFDRDGRGIVRSTAIDASAFSSDPGANKQ